jgi:hypothetical protein
MSGPLDSRNGDAPGSPLAAALSYLRSGLSVIPIRPDGSKRPTLAQWKRFQDELPTENHIRGYWRDGTRGIGIIGGAVSGNLETIDFDRGELFGSWCALVEAQAPGLVPRLCVVRTPREPAGYHVRYRCREASIPGNLKLAQEPGTDPKTGKPCVVTLIETRGQGGYAIAPGSPPACHETGRTYDHIAGPALTDLADITAGERDTLLAAARSYDLLAGAKGKRPAAAAAAGGGGALRPGDDFDRRGPEWSAILEPHGWECGYSRGDTSYWRRPGKDGPGFSATTGYCKGRDGVDLLAVFSSNADPFDGPSGASPCTCYGKFAAYALLNHGGDFKAAARELARQGYGEQRRRRQGKRGGDATDRPGGAPPGGESGESGEEGCERPEIVITTEEHEVNAEAAGVLTRDPTLYQRGGMLVRVVRDTSPAAGGIRRPFAPRIEPLPSALLRERLAANARWVALRETNEGPEPVPARPPGWCVAAVHARAEWPGVRHLEAVVEYPVLRPDGTILDRAGYDDTTGLLLDFAGELPTVPPAPSYREAIDARDALLEVVADFPFEQDCHRAAWLAALLTPLARFAFTGPAPLFLVDANVRAAGKGLLLDCISRIISGERFTVATYTSDEDELRKRITSLALAGDRLVLFDNLEGRFGNATLDAALTAASWEDRVLGVNRMARAPLFVTWYATGNNVAVGADTARRVCHVRLESPEERPEERGDFAHADLLAFVAANRSRLLGAALTILRAYDGAGRPQRELRPWGSFDGWSRLVRGAVVWVGEPDPGETRYLLQEQADVTAEAMSLLLCCWEQMDLGRQGMTAAEVIDRLFKRSPESPPPWHAEMRSAVESLVGRGDSRALGNKLRSYRRRIFRGRFIDQAGTEHRAARWVVRPVSEFRRPAGKDSPDSPDSPPGTAGAGRPGESGEWGESFSANGRADDDVHGNDSEVL